MRKQRQSVRRGSKVVFLLIGSLGFAGCDNLGSDSSHGRSAALAGLTASFDWSMPARTTLTGNALDPVDPNPSTFKVNFDACASAPSAGITQFRWTFGDGQTTTATKCSGVSHDYASEGHFTVSLTVAAADGSTASASNDVNVQDFLIIGLGDSYGSGEGSPDEEIPPNLITEWIQLGIDIGQLENERLHVTQLLGFLDDLIGPAENFLHCAVCSPDGIGEDFCFAAICAAAGGICPFPAVCIACKDGCASAATDFATAFGKAVAQQGLETLQQFENDPTGVVGEARRLKDELNLTLQAIDLALATKRHDRDILPDKAKVVWDNAACHRSSWSAQARTALAMEAADPKSSVTFLHLACTGAVTADVTKDDQGQLAVAAQKIGGREVDAVLVSIGGNDAKFADIIMAGIFQEPTNDPTSPGYNHLTEALLGIPGLCSATGFLFLDCIAAFDAIQNKGFGPSGKELFDGGVATLDGNYQTLNTHLNSAFQDKLRDSRRVLITPYPDATHDESGTICGPRLDRLPDIQTIPGWTPPEFTWGFETVISGINSHIQTAVNNNTWTFVDGVFQGFARHGVCSDQNWINRIQQSFMKQGDYLGSVHPNRAGYAEIASHMIPLLQAQLFSGPGGTARAPLVPPIADAGPPIVVNEGSSYVIVNNSVDPSRTSSLTYAWSLAISPAGTASLGPANAAVPTIDAFDDGVGSVSLTLTSEFGSDTASTPVTVANVAPAVTGGPALATVEGTPITLNATFVDPGLRDTHAGTIDWGDGTTSTVAVSAGARALSATHTYQNQGVYTAQVTVRDDDGGAGTASVQTTVTNLPPSLGPMSGPDHPTKAGTLITVSASFTDPGVLDRHTGTIDWDDGTTSAATIVESGGSGTVSGTHSYTHPGPHYVTIVVTDDAGASVSVIGRFVTTGPKI